MLISPMPDSYMSLKTGEGTSPLIDYGVCVTVGVGLDIAAAVALSLMRLLFDDAEHTLS